MNHPFVRLTLLCITAILMMAVAASSTVASPPLPSQANVTSVQFDDEVLTVEVRGDYAYVGLDRGLAILDITQPTHAIVRGMIGGSLNDYTTIIAFTGNYVVTSGGSGSFRIIDVTQPALPVKVFESFELPGLADIQDMAVFEEFAYLADGGTRQFAVVDISDPLAPVVVGAVPDRGELKGLDVAPDATTGRLYAYVVGYPVEVLTDVWVGGGLRVLDVTEPTNPQEVYPCSNADPCAQEFGPHDIRVQGQFAYIANYRDSVAGAKGLTIYDLADPLHPVGVGAYPTHESSYHVTTSGNRTFFTTAYMPYPWQGDLLYSIDVTDKAHPRSLAAQELDQNRTGGLAASQAKGCVFAAQQARGLKILCQATADLTPPSLTYLPMLTRPAG